MSNCRTSASQPGMNPDRQRESGVGVRLDSHEWSCCRFGPVPCFRLTRPRGSSDQDPTTLLPSPKLPREQREAVSTIGIPLGSEIGFHGRARWLRRHFRIGDNMARPTGVACKPTLIRSTAGDGSGGINSLRHTKPWSPTSTSHSSAFLTRSCHEAFSNAVVLKYWSDQSGRTLVGTVRDRLASCLKSSGCVWRISSRRDIWAGDRYGKCLSRMREGNIRPRLAGQTNPAQSRSFRWRTNRGSPQLF